MLQFLQKLQDLECNDALVVLFRTNPPMFQKLENDADFLAELRGMDDLAARETAILGYGAFDLEQSVERNIANAQPEQAGTGFTPSDTLDQGNSEALAEISPEQLARMRRDEHADAPAPEQVADRRLRPWHHGKVRFSNRSYYGGPFAGQWADGREHLVPERHFVEAVIRGHLSGNESILHNQGKRWWEQIEEFAAEDSVYGPLTECACEHIREMHQVHADADRVWFGHSFGIRDALTQALARRAHQMLELTEANDTVANAGNDPAEWMTTRLERTKELYDQAKLEAGYWMRIWREERERAFNMEKMVRDAASEKDPRWSSRPLPNADPDSIQIDFAVTRHLIRWAQYQEREMVTDPKSQQTQASQHERYMAVAL